MINGADGIGETEYELRHRELRAGQARSAVFRRTYNAAIEDVWHACTTPERLRRWYAPVEGELRVGGSFTQGDFGPGTVTRCDPPNLFTAELGHNDPPTDEIELRLSVLPGGGTLLEFEHATTLDTHEIGGEIFDAVYCMGGGYGPRLITLEQHLLAALPAELDPATLHMRPAYLPAINDSMKALKDLLEADRDRAVPRSSTNS